MLVRGVVVVAPGRVEETSPLPTTEQDPRPGHRGRDIPECACVSATDRDGGVQLSSRSAPPDGAGRNRDAGGPCSRRGRHEVIGIDASIQLIAAKLSLFSGARSSQHRPPADVARRRAVAVLLSAVALACLVPERRHRASTRLSRCARRGPKSSAARVPRIDLASLRRN